MCVIIIKQKDNVISREVAKTSSQINPHGLGIVWLDTFEVEYHKSSEYKRLLTERPFIAHFRYATVGKIGRENTHPFVCGSNKDELLMMNGTIKGLGNDKVCDSKALAIQIGNTPRHTWKSQLEKYECRFVTINKRTRTFQIYNRDLYTYRDGVWYSKSNVLQDNVVAVYGTLKKGFGNYYHYLTDSKFVGSGTTKDKYPLLVEGLPYLVDKKGIGHNVNVDVFKVDDATLRELDLLEGHPRWYVRRQIPIKMKNGVTISCWVYFNPKQITSASVFHKSYERTFKLTDKDYDDNLWSNDWAEDCGCAQYELFDTDFEDTTDKYCIDCFHDLEHDGFHNYHCSGCGKWYSETEVEQLND